MSDSSHQDETDEHNPLKQLASQHSLTVCNGDEGLQQRLADILDDYLEQIENGTPVSTDELVRRHPDLAEPLREFLGGLDMLQADLMHMAPAPARTEQGFGLRPAIRRLGDYDILGEIGRGGMGIVYEAQQISLDRRVALKVLPFASMLDKRQIVRFENEARAAARLHHAHIVPVHGVGCERGVHYYAMQFINGQSVRELIDSRREEAGERIKTKGDSSSGCSQLALEQINQIARLGIQAANALQTAHECGIVHRDIKPSNLMLDSESDLWITDFGLASCHTDRNDCNVTQTGDVIGTLHYMSPEQARGDAAIADPRSDIYSLGVTLYEMLTLQRPFEGNTHADILKQIEFGQCNPVRYWNVRVPRDLENVIAKAMSPLPEERYQTASQLEQDLQRFADGKATRAKPPSKAKLASRWAARNRGLVASATTALGVIGVTLIAATIWMAAEQSNLRVRHDQANQKLATTEKAFEEFGLATAERMKQIPGSESARKALLADLLQHYDDLLESAADNPSLRADRAVTSTKIANVYRQSGDPQSAIRSYRSAQADFRELAESANPSTTATAGQRNEYTAQLARCLSSASVVLYESGDLDEAVSEAREAIRLQEGLQESRNNAVDQLSLANSYLNLGTIEFESNPESAVASLRRATNIIRRELKGTYDKTTKIDALKTLSAAYQTLSTGLRKTNPTDALKYGEFAVKSAEMIVDLAPDQDSFQATLATNCNNLATLCVGLEQPERAISLYRRATAALRTTGTDQSLVVTLSNLAKIQITKGDMGAASDSYREAITIQSSLLLGSPANLNYVSRLGGLHNNLAFVQQRNGQPAAACVTFESAIEYQRRAFELAPANIATYRDALSRTYYNASRAELAADRPFRAAGIEQLRAELWPSDAGQLFSVANHLASTMTKMPHDDPRRNEWKTVATATLEKAIAVDHERQLNAIQTAKLARFLDSQLDKSKLPAGGLVDRSRLP